MVYVLSVLGLLLLIAGAEALVRGASRLAAAAGITPLVIGLTVVAFGTSAPELTVSILAALEGQAGADIAVGNVVGSNIFNVLFILGVSALIAPLVVAQKLVRVDVPVMIGLSALVLLFGLGGDVSRLEGFVLFAGIVGYTVFAIRQGRKESAAVADEYAEAFGAPSVATNPRTLASIGLIGVGLGMLVVGSRWLVDGAVTLAEALGLSELIISLTIIAAGTSLPEVATSVLASVRGERDIAVGNVVGSNIFNILCVLGLSAVVAPEGIRVAPAALAFDVPVMIATAVLCLPIFFTGYQIGRLEAILFLAYYVAYVAYLVLAASAHETLPMFSSVMLYAVLPATVLLLALSVLRQVRRKT